ncbi:MAG: Ig-like domain-containing protein, partial [Bacteroidota bacterium]
FTGEIEVPYVICDDGTPQACDTAVLAIDVAPLPDGTNNNVIANDDDNVTYPSIPVSSSVTSNDADPEGDNFTVTGFVVDSDGDGVPDSDQTGSIGGSAVTVGGVDQDGNPVANAGTLSMDANGDYTYTPAAGFTGTVTVDYTITDDNADGTASDVATLVITVEDDPAGNNPPFAGDDFAYTDPGTPVTIATGANDPADPDGDQTGTPVVLTNPSNGTVVVNNDGTMTYTPNGGVDSGTDQYTYVVCDTLASNAPNPLCDTATVYITIGPEDNTTIVIDDDNNTFVNTPVSGDVSTNDSDPDGDNLDFQSFLNQDSSGVISTGASLAGTDDNGNPVDSAGTITFDADGGYTFTPAANFTGTVEVPYESCDDGTPQACDTAILLITVSPIPDPLDPTSNDIIANDDDNVSFGNPVSGDLFVNDVDPEDDNFNVEMYTYDSDGDGEPDAIGTLNSAVSVGGVDEDGNPVTNAGSLVLNDDGTYTFTPSNGFSGTVEVDYEICDDVAAPNTACTDATLTIEVMPNENGPANDPPFAGDDFNMTYSDIPVDGIFSANDNDPNNDDISLDGVTIDPNGSATPIGSPVSTDQGGTVQFYSDGTYTYTPPTGYYGPDFVEYEICDVTVVNPQPLCNMATIYFTVIPAFKEFGDLDTAIYGASYHVISPDLDG